MTTERKTFKTSGDQLSGSIFEMIVADAVNVFINIWNKRLGD
jgi:hypothetical protein